MTNGEYMREKLRAFDVTEAQLLDSGINLTDNYVPNSRNVALAIIKILEDMVLSPIRTNISENGFSVSWDTQNIAKYYKYLCKIWRVTPNSDIVEDIKIPTIKDVSETW